MTAPFGPGAPGFLAFDSRTTPQALPGRTRRALPSQGVGYTPWWIDEPDVWDLLSLGDVTLPGLARVTGRIERKVSARHAGGTDGASLADRGFKPAEFAIALVFWSSEQLNTWEAQVLPLINPRRDAARRVAYDIYHPALAQLGIRQAYIKSIGILHPGTVSGTMETDFACIERTAVVARGTVVAHPTFAAPSALVTPGSPNAAPAPPPAPSSSTTP